GGGEGHGGYDDPLSSLEANGFEGQVQGGGAGIDRDRVLMSEILRKFHFKLLGLRAGRQPAAPERIHHLAYLVFADGRLVEGDFHSSLTKAESRKQLPARSLQRGAKAENQTTDHGRQDH